MDRKTILGCNAIVLVVSIIQIIAGAIAIRLGNDITSSTNNQLYSIVYTPQANFYIAAGVLTLLLTGYAIFVNLNNSINAMMTNSVFFSTITVLCLQFAMAIYSSITANVMSQSAASFSEFPNNQCSCVTVNNIFIAVAIITWVMSLPVTLIELNNRWQDCRKLEVQQEPPAIDGPDTNARNSIRDSLR